MRTLSILLCAALSLGACSNSSKKREEQQAPAPAKKAVKSPVMKQTKAAPAPAKPATRVERGEMTLEEVKSGVANFKEVLLSYPEKELKPELRPVVKKLIEAAFIMDRIFLRQVSRSNESRLRGLKRAVAKDAGLKPYLDYFRIMYGPWDRTHHNKPFWGRRAKPPGAGFYAPGITKKLFNDRVAELEKVKGSRDRKAAATAAAELEGLKSYYTVVQRAGDKLLSVPFHKYYKKDVEKAAALLNEAAKLSKEKSLSEYLSSRAKALLDDDYRASDFAWLKIQGDLEVVIGPYEVYEDELNGFKAAYEAFVTLVDQRYSAKLKELSKYSADLDRNLPYADAFRGGSAVHRPIKVVNELYTAGDTKAGVQTLAFNLPNDPVVRGDKEKGGYKLVLLKNVAEAKFSAILLPIAHKLMDKEQWKHVTFDAFFTHTLYHESAHGIGPSFVTVKGKKVKIREFMKEYGSANEEAKADMGGLLGLEYMISKLKNGTDAQLKAGWVTFVASIFRSIRFGATEAHGKANIMALNYLMDGKAVVYDAKTGTFRVDFALMGKVTRAFVKEILDVQTGGSYEKAAAFEKRWANMSEVVKTALARLGGIPVDISPRFKVIEDLEMTDPR